MIYTGILLFILVLIFAFQKQIDPLFVPLLKEEDLNQFISEDIDEFVLKRIRKSKIVLILLLFWERFELSVLYLFIVLALFFFLLKKDYISLKQKRVKQINLLKFQFPIWLRQLQMLLQTNTVSQSLKLSYSHAPELIKNDLSRLIQEIDQDALNITPYLNFLKSYRLNEIERAMKLLYRYNTIGKEDAYLQFNRMIQTTTKWLRSERKSHHQNTLTLYEWISMFPLVGVTVLFLAIMCEVIINMLTTAV